ncbi:polyisoprenyl-teichoic acid--peptidoglycan teichoic acid transferase TagU [Neobacillus vireti]|uniref:Polyisoprenyl-teichoic acid--peptidoglycan teichoic acid transferase TagU n=1 Tax=Neobacillus vireti LMG 21834 TaxID=1131730 RepID=A0AB94IQ84_9BACI|nr:LytR family transcriptional regulator [Neobacillus vireti]ETI69172.1 membrane-bound transcriptional regulator LytR [Neobacillus vireti LMG 21834]KLT15549.1 trascriptional regulator [Neobacillus vireti]
MRSENKKNRKWLKVTGIVLLVLIIGAGAYAFTVYKSLKNAVTTMHEPIDRKQSDKRQEPVSFKDKNPFTVLMLGVDERPGDRGRSDTMIVLAVNPNNKSVKMLSIPRDTRTEIVGKGKDDKINHAYAFGGVPMSMDTVENFLDIPIDYYMKVNMEGFKDIVDAVGGITVQNNLDFTQDKIHFAKGEINLNGTEALAFTRMRKQDPNGDFGRQGRQRQIIQGVIKEGASVSSLANFSDIFTALGKNVKTNLSFDDLIDIQKNYKDAGSNIQQMEIKETGTKIDKIYYGLVSAEEKQRVQSELKAQLEIQ